MPDCVHDLHEGFCLKCGDGPLESATGSTPTPFQVSREQVRAQIAADPEFAYRELGRLGEALTAASSRAAQLTEALRDVLDEIDISTERYGDSSAGPATVNLEPGELPISEETYNAARALLASSATTETNK